MYGASTTLGTLLLELRTILPAIQSVACIKYSKEHIKCFQESALEITESNRMQNSLPCFHKDNIPNMRHHTNLDIIYDKGGVGFEAIIRVLGTSPGNVFNKIMLLEKPH